MDLNLFFEPRSIAVIGASADPKKVGAALMRNLLAGPPERAIYPVSVSADEVLGKRAVKSVKDIEGDVDLALIAVRPDIVPGIVRECGEKGIRHVVVISAGFKEIGPDGAKLEEEVSRAAAEQGIALLGPNCLGVVNAHAGLNASFAAGMPPAGGVSFISQSGAMGTALLDLARTAGLGFAKFVSLGNEAGLTELDFLPALADDRETKLVLAYFEKIADGPRFIEAARQLTAKKPLIILRAGRSSRGRAAVSSHTGSLAPDDAVFRAAARAAGAVTVDSAEDLVAAAQLVHLGLARPARRLVVLTNGGGPSIVAADEIDASPYLALTAFTDGTKEELRKALPPMAAVGNPVDVIGDAPPERYDAALTIIENLGDADAVLALVTPQLMTDMEGTARVMIAHRERKPILPVFLGGPAPEPARKALRDAGMPVFDYPAQAVRALEAFAVPHGRIEKEAPVAGGGKERRMMAYPDMQKLFADYGIGLDGMFVAAKSGLGEAMSRIGGPAALKGISPAAVHKSDVHAIRLDVADAEDAEAAWDDIKKNVGGALDGMVVQPMRKGLELILGMKRDATFGPVLLFGLGGIFVEALHDTALRVAPVSRDEALAMLREVQGAKLLDGARGMAPVKKEALAELIEKLSKLSVEHSEILEIDLNPVIADGEHAYVVDARILLT
jgi:acetyl coenzyme A synthetase (ADP forming)-like protein